MNSNLSRSDKEQDYEQPISAKEVLCLPLVKIYNFRSAKAKSETSSKRKRKRRKSSESSNKSSPASLKEESKPAEGKNLLEILELEMRARAIRALLKQNSEKEKMTGENASGDQVDLTQEDEDNFPTVIKTEPPSQLEETFTNKVVQSVGIDKLQEEAEANVKKQRLMAEQELRNRLVKKKAYRTRLQRLENHDMEPREEEEQATEEAAGSTVSSYINGIQVKPKNIKRIFFILVLSVFDFILVISCHHYFCTTKNGQ